MPGQQRVVVVGGGVGGLVASIALARDGFAVTVLEQDPLPDAPDVESAFAAERSGAPQSHQTHGFLARVVVELREHLPDVLERLLDAGCITMPTTANLGEPQPGDEDLRVLIVRRTTFEWVLRTAALDEPGVSIRGGAPVRGLVGSPAGSGPAVVTGVRLDDGTVIEADMVVAATGRRSRVDAWLGELGVDVREKAVPSGLMYLSRWYRMPGGYDITMDAKLGGDLGFVKFLAVPGDGETLSITLAIRPDDKVLRSTLSEDDRFEAACRLLPGPDLFFGGDFELHAIGGVRPMGGLLNRVRHFTDETGEPTVVGFHAVGDAHTTTNPLYGRGCSLALVQGLRLAAAARANPGDAVGRARDYERSAEREIRPWFEVSVQMDRLGADPAGAGALVPGGSESSEAKGLAAVFASAATDPIIGRGIARFMNTLATPADLMADAALLTRIAEVMADPDQVEIPRREGPSRRELLEGLGVPVDDDAEVPV